MAELQNRLADPATYDDPELTAKLVAEHDAAKDLAAEHMDAWEKLSERLDQ